MPPVKSNSGEAAYKRHRAGNPASPSMRPLFLLMGLPYSACGQSFLAGFHVRLYSMSAGCNVHSPAGWRHLREHEQLCALGSAPVQQADCQLGRGQLALHELPVRALAQPASPWLRYVSSLKSCHHDWSGMCRSRPQLQAMLRRLCGATRDGHVCPKAGDGAHH